MLAEFVCSTLLESLVASVVIGVNIELDEGVVVDNV